MAIRELPPVREKPEYFEAIEAEIIAILRQEIYIPLMVELGQKRSFKNAYVDLIQAIHDGQIRYLNGHFEGKFDSILSRELRGLGAEWDRKHGWWKIPQSKLSHEMIVAIGMGRARLKALAEKLDKRLKKLDPKEIAARVQLDKLFGKTLTKVSKDFNKSVKGITIEANLTPYQTERIASEYTKNMQLYIQEWAQKEIVELRKKVEVNSFAGFRYESMVDSIRESYGVSQAKAKFLARQETSLLMSKYKQTRYQEAGIQEYKWHCVAGSPAHPVRPAHLALNGKIFRYDSPPVVDDKGDRKNPGQDYNCRCVDIPVVRF